VIMTRAQARLCVRLPPCADALQGTQDANGTGRRHKGTRCRHARTLRWTRLCGSLRTGTGDVDETGLSDGTDAAATTRQSEGLLHAGCGWQVAGRWIKALTMNSPTPFARGREGCVAHQTGVPSGRLIGSGIAKRTAPS